jgi:hypothetical protein
MSSISKISYNENVQVSKKESNRQIEQEEKRNILVRFEPSIADGIDEFRHDHRFSSRNEAINWLVEYALKQKPKRS